MAGNKEGLCSVCCLGYNHAAFLEQNIRAIWSGEYRNIEIIVVDDGSTDGSPALLRTLAEQSPFPMTVIEQENTGNIGKNFNTALKYSNGEFITFMSLDDVLFPNAISKKIDFMKKNPLTAFVASSKIIAISDDGVISDSIEKLSLCDMDNPDIDDMLRLEYEDLNSFYIQGSVFRKDIVDAVNGFDEDMIGDDIVLRTKIFLYIKANPEYTFRIIKFPACYYRMHDNNIHKNVARQLKLATQYLDRYWPEKAAPNTLIEWAKFCIFSMPFAEYMKVFASNLKAASLLLDPVIQVAVQRSVLISAFPQLLNNKNPK